jgi:hypothetical protein
VQFVCFETNIDFEKFIGHWEHYAKKFESKEVKTSLLEQVNVKSRYKYISQHMASPDELQFTFMKEKRSVILPESKIKIIQAGGYKPLQQHVNQPESSDTFKVILFVPKSVYDIEPFKKMAFHSLHIFEAYFESCNYSFVLEFIVNESAGDELMKEIKDILHNPDIGMYKDCSVLEG